MAECPVCHNEVPDDFGLIECGECKAPLLIQLDGTVQSMAESDISKADSLPDIGAVSNSLPMAEEPVASEMMPSDLPQEDHGMEEPSEPMEEQVEQQIEVKSAPTPEDVDAFFDENPLPPPVPVPTTPINDLSNLANTTDTNPQAGALRYNIAISGIDTAEIRKEFREVLTDRRFTWDVDQIVRSIRAGKVQMQNITAVKSILLIQRLRALPVHVQWEQHVVHQD